MTNLETLHAKYEAAEREFEDAIISQFPGLTKWDWFRACDRIEGGIGRRNDDTSQDEALASNARIRAAHDDYISKLHKFYSLRDGPRGFLARRGMR
jgi:hypothetical protein